MNSASSVLCLVLLGAELCAAVLAMHKLYGEAWAATCLWLTSDEMMVMPLVMTIMRVAWWRRRWWFTDNNDDGDDGGDDDDDDGDGDADDGNDDGEE